MYSKNKKTFVYLRMSYIVTPVKAALFSCFQPEVINEQARFLQPLLFRNRLILEVDILTWILRVLRGTWKRFQ